MVVVQTVWPIPFVPGTASARCGVPDAYRTTTPVPKLCSPAELAPASRQVPSDVQPTPYRYWVPATIFVVSVVPPVRVATMPCSVLFSPTATQRPAPAQSIPFRYHALATLTAAFGVPEVMGTIAGT